MYIHIHVCICRDTGTYIDHINDAVLHKHLPIRTPRSCVEFPKFSSTLILYSKYQLWVILHKKLVKNWLLDISNLRRILTKSAL